MTRALHSLRRPRADGDSPYAHFQAGERERVQGLAPGRSAGRGFLVRGAVCETHPTAAVKLRLPVASVRPATSAQTTCATCARASAPCLPQQLPMLPCRLHAVQHAHQHAASAQLLTSAQGQAALVGSWEAAVEVSAHGRAPLARRAAHPPPPSCQRGAGCRNWGPDPEARRAAGPRLRAEAAQVADQVREQLAHERRHVALQRRRRQRGARAAQPAPHVAQQRVCVPARGHTQGWHAGPERDA